MNKNKGFKIACIIAGIVILAAVAVGGLLLYKNHKESQALEAAQQELAQAEEQKKQEEQLAKEQAEKEAQEAAQQETAEQEEDQAQSEDTQVEDAAVNEVNEQPQEQSEEETTPEDTQPTSNGHMIAIDAGHQAHGNSEQEEIGPGAGEYKPKVASGTYGPASGLNEYELNLQVSLKLRDELAARGYQVYMIRETNDVNISNHERADLAAASGADILIRIHANGSDDSSVNGTLTMAPGADNPYMSQELISQSMNLSQIVVDNMCAVTGTKNMGVQRYNNMSGINWSQIPVTIVEMGFMTNSQDDLNMADASYQDLMVQGMSNGIDQYFAS